MKYTLIKETDKIKLISAKDIVRYDGFDEPAKKGETCVPTPDVIVERDIVKTKIFTDGEIKGIASLDSSLSDLPINLSNMKIDKTELSELELLNHNYVIRILTALEFQKRGSVYGWYDVIKDVEIYLRDKKDKDAIRKVKKTLELVCSNREYASIFELLLPQKPVQINISYNEEKEGIYQLRKTKQK